VVYTVKDSYNDGMSVPNGQTFTLYGITNFNVQYWNGSAFVDVPGGAVTGNTQVRRSFLLSPEIITDKIRVVINDSADHRYSRIAEIEAYSCSPVAVPTPCDTNNVARSTAGATAVGSSEFSPSFPASGAIDGEHNGNNWGAGGGWNDGTAGVFPDDLVINFNGSKTINHIDVYTLKDDYNSGSAVNDSTFFTLFGATDYRVQYWNGSAFIDVPGGAVVGNTHVKRKFVFPQITTDKIRVLVNAAGSSSGSYSRIVEVEAFSCTP
jgi:hypothetical protein